MALLVTLISLPLGCYRAELPPELSDRESLHARDRDSETNAERSDELSSDNTGTSLADAQPSIEAFPVSDEPWIEASELPWEIGYAQYLGGRRIGYFVIRVTESALDIPGQLRVRREEIIDVQSNGTAKTLSTTLDSVESNVGKVKSFTLTSDIDSEQEQLKGTLVDGRMSLVTSFPSQEDARPKRNKLEWEEGTWGVVGVPALLRRSPMSDGDRRSGKLFVPQLQAIANMELTAKAPELTLLPDGEPKRLTPVEVRLSTDEAQVHSTYWIDESGMVEKIMPESEPSVVMFRISSERLTQLQTARQITGLLGRRLPVEQSDRLIDAADSPVLQVTSQTRDPFALLAQTPLQSLQSLGPRSSRVRLQTVALDQLSSSDSPPPAGDEKGQGSSADTPAETENLDAVAIQLLRTQHEEIEALADELLGEEPLSTSQKAERLAEQLAERLVPRRFDGNFAPILRTVRGMRGHAGDVSLLLTSLLQNQGIPARVVTGFHWNPPAAAESDAADSDRSDWIAGFHIWVEFELDDQWVPLDAVDGRVAGPDRVRFINQSLDVSNPDLLIADGLEIFHRIDRIVADESDAE